MAELVSDKLPKTPPRTSPPVFGARIVMGGVRRRGARRLWGYYVAALGAGIIGAVLGTLGGYQARKRAGGRDAVGKDLPIALLEDAVAILGGFAIVAIATCDRLPPLGS